MDQEALAWAHISESVVYVYLVTEIEIDQQANRDILFKLTTAQPSTALAGAYKRPSPLRPLGGSLFFDRSSRRLKEPGASRVQFFGRNFGIFFVFASYREVKFRYFSVFFVFKFKNSKIFIKNSKKYDKKLGVLLSKQDQNTLKSKIICQAKINI